MTAGPATFTPPSELSARRVDAILALADGDRVRAVDQAVQAKSDGAKDPRLHHFLALALKDDGRPADAVVEAGEGLALDPANVPLLITVGFCLLDLDRRQEAAQVFETALKLDATSDEAFYGYGWAAERLGALAQAKSAWERAAALNPRHAHALAGLSGLAARRRDWSTARELADRAVALDARQTDALMNLVRADIGEGDFTAAEQRLRELIGLPHLNERARANAWIMLGDALDGAGRFNEAFDAYAKGKADIRAQAAATFEAEGGRSASDAVRRLLAEFKNTNPADWTKTARASKLADHREHAFLLGFPRSGTTLLEQVLASHPDIVAMGERPAMVKGEIEFLAREGGVQRLAGVVGDFLEPYREDYWRRVREFGLEPRGKVFVDKQPLNTFRLPLISKLFPQGKIIFAVRDPRDIVLSCFRRSFNLNASTYEFNTIESAARYYAAVMESGEAYFDALPLNVHRLRYEDLVGDFSGETRRLCNFLGVPWTDDLAKFADTAGERMIATPSSAQVGRGLYEEGVAQWRNYAFALESVEPVLKPWIDKFGYAPT